MGGDENEKMDYKNCMSNYFCYMPWTDYNRTKDGRCSLLGEDAGWIAWHSGTAVFL